MIELLFLLIADGLDVFFSSIFPPDPSKMSASVIFQFAFIALILISRKKDKIDSYLLAFIMGAFVGNRLNDFFLEIGIFYFLIIVLIQNCFKNFDEDFIEALIIIVFAILIKEIMFYGLMLFYQRTSMTLSNWFLRRCIPTLFGNLVPVLLMLMLDHYKDSILYRKEMIRRREESLFFKSAEARMKKK